MAQLPTCRRILRYKRQHAVLTRRLVFQPHRRRIKRGGLHGPYRCIDPCNVVRLDVLADLPGLGTRDDDCLDNRAGLCVKLVCGFGVRFKRNVADVKVEGVCGGKKDLAAF